MSDPTTTDDPTAPTTATAYDFNIMLGMVNHYCNQCFTPKRVPPGLQVTINQMVDYANSIQPGTGGFSIGSFSVSTTEDLFRAFSGRLSQYKRLKTL